MKKHIILIAILALIAFLGFACSKDNNNEKPDETPKLSVTFSNPKQEMTVGEKQTITFEAKNGTATVEFKSSDESVLTVSASGEVAALKAGSASISCNVKEDSSLSKSFTITVKDKEVTVVKYTYKFLVDGVVVKEETLDEGSNIVAPSDPTKDPTNEFTFVFKGWDKQVGKLTSDIEFNAVFEQVARKYTLTLNVDGTKTSKEYAYNEQVTLEAASKEGFDFVGWKDASGATLTSVTMTGDLELTAVFEEKSFTISYTLNGGTCDLIETATYGEEVTLPVPTKEGCNFLGWKVNGEGEYAQKITVTADVTVEAFFEDKMCAVTYNFNGGTEVDLPTSVKYGETLTLTPVTKEGYNFLGWFYKGEVVTSIEVKQDIELTAKFEAKKFKVEYDLDGGVLLQDLNSVRVGGNLVLPKAYKNGAKFLGWTLDGSSSSEYQTEIINAVKDYKFVAHWETADLVYVGEGFYATFDEALAAVNEGGTICFMPGLYGAISVTKKVTLTSLNQGHNPNLTKFVDDAEFNADIEIVASDVTIDALTLTDKGRFNVHGNIANTTFVNVRVYGSTLNYQADQSNTAPFYLIGGNGDIIKNLVMENVLIEQRDTGRPMIIFGYDIEDLTIVNSCFYGGTVVSLYNDGIKIENPTDAAAPGCQFGIRGNVTIMGNTFTNYSQYVIWLRGYAEGTYRIVNNKFIQIGQTAASHALATWIKYTGDANGEGTIDISYNLLQNGYILVRMDDSPAGFKATVHYNKMIDCAGTDYIRNKGKCEIDAQNNYFGTNAPEAGKFTGVKTYENFYASADEVPVYGEQENKKFSITYDLNGGEWEATKLSIDDAIELLLAGLSTYYGTEVTKDNVHVISEAASTPRMFNFFEQADWHWLRDYMIYCRTNDAKQSGGKDYLNTTSEYANTYWRYEVAGFVNKKAWESWPYSSDYSSEDFKDYFTTIAIKGNAKEGPKEYVTGLGIVLLAPAKEGFAFDGWFDEQGNCYKEVPFGFEKDLNLKAQWSGAVEPDSVEVLTDLSDGIEILNKVQLEWAFDPADTYNQRVTFISTDESIFTVSKDGLITALKEGEAKLKIKVDANSELDKEIKIRVYKPAHFEISYETESYVKQNETIKLNAQYILPDKSSAKLVWESFAESIATVDANGVVTGVDEGDTTIRCKLADDETKFVDFGVSVLPNRISDVLEYVLACHNSNAFVHYDLGIGAGTPVYYADIIGSLSDVLFNQPLTINTKYESVQAGVDSNHGGTKSSTEFITVHYTGNMNKTATASANANYFATGGGGTSIHYVTGNDGVYHVLDDSLVGFHAGDGTKVTFEWTKTGVKYDEADPKWPVFGINSNSYFTINGKDTTIPVPEGTTAATKKVTSSKWINNMGLPFKVVDGEYYMGTTYWCYSQVAEGRICSHGGNLNSIGIESAVNEGTDLWYTWHKTAQLVAKLMLDNDLDITRVVGHHFFSAKDCPQPLLENDLEIWWKFIDMVELEYKLLTEFKDYKFTLTLMDNSQTFVNSFGRINMPDAASTISYELSWTNTQTGASDSIILTTSVNGIYSK